MVKKKKETEQERRQRVLNESLERRRVNQFTVMMITLSLFVYMILAIIFEWPLP
jgi:hypothetical protein